MAVGLLALMTLLGGARLLPPESIVPKDDAAAAVYYAHLGGALASWGAYDAALANFRQSLKRKPDRPTAQLGLAECLAHLGQGDEAVAAVREILKRTPGDYAASRFYGELMLRGGEVAQARQMLDRAVRQRPDDSRAHRLFGVALMLSRRLADAEVELRTAARLDPFDPEVYAPLAQVMMGLDRQTAAMAALRKLTDLRPDDVPALQQLAELYLGNQFFDQALELGYRLVELEPQEPRFALGVADVLRRLRRPEEAAKYFARGLALDPPAPMQLAAAQWLAEYHIGHSRFTTAADYAKRVTRLKPELLPPRMMLVRCYLMAGDFAAAAGAVRGLVALQPGNLGFRMQLFELYLRAHSYRAALRAAADIADRWRDRPLVQAQLAQQMLMADGQGYAASLIERACRRFPTVPELAFVRYEVYRRLGREEAAGKVIEALHRQHPDEPAPRRELGFLAFQRRDWDRVVALLRPLFDSGRIDPLGVNALAWAYERSGRYPEAAGVFEGLAAAAKQPLLMRHVGRQLDHMGRAADCVRLYRQILEKVPNHVPTLIDLGRSLANAGDLPAAEEPLRRALELEPGNAFALRSLALVLATEGRGTEAEDTYRELAKVDPTNAYAVAGEGDVAAMGQDLERAMAVWRQGLERLPRSAALHERMGQAYRQQGDVAHALAELEAAARYAPGDPASRLDLARLTEHEGRFSDARRWWREALDLLPESPYPYRRWLASFGAAGEARLGLESGLQLLSARPGSEPLATALLDRAGDTHDVSWLASRLAEFLAAGSADPGLRDAYGRALAREGRVAEALDWFAKQAAEEPRDPRWLLRQGEVREAQGEPDEAVALYRAALVVAPKHAGAREDLARALAAKGQADEAVDGFTTLVDQRPDDVEPLLRLVRAFHRAKLLDPLRSALRQGLEPAGEEPGRWSSHPAVWAAYGLACELSGAVGEAAEAYRTALGMGPNQLAAKQGLQRLDQLNAPSGGLRLGPRGRR